MSVALCGTVIQLVGPGRIEDAEPMVTLLQAEPGRSVDLTRAGPLHTAVMQVLLAFRPPVVGPAGEPFVESWLMPLLIGRTAEPAVVADALDMAEQAEIEKGEP